MASYFTLTLDTTGPASPSISLDSGAEYATAQLVTATIGTTDGPTTGYQMKIWGDVDTTHNPSIQATEVASAWISYATSQQVKLSSGDGSKTVYLKIRDDVYNESAQASDTIILDMTLPVVTVSNVSATKISKVAGKDTITFQFSGDTQFDAYKVKVVATSGAAHDTGTQIGTTNGSSNVSGSEGNYPAATPITVTIKGADLETASGGDGAKIVKVFIQDDAGNWSA